MVDSPTPRTIPESVKHEVRQRCGFGCVICGIPIYHYDHIYGFDETKPHLPEEITLLCALHHDEKTRGLLPNDQVISANAQPVNVAQGVTAPYQLHFSGNKAVAFLGGNYFESVALDEETKFFAPVIIDDIDPLSFEIHDGRLYLNAFFLDPFNNPILQIIHNEIVFSTAFMDITFVGKKSGGGLLTILPAKNKVLIQILFQPPGSIRITQGSIFCNGVRINVKDGMMDVVGANIGLSMIGNHFQRPVGLVIGDRCQYGAGIRLSNVLRYPPASTTVDGEAESAQTSLAEAADGV